MVSGNTVFVTDGNFEKALRKFKKKVAESKVLQELKEREHYVKPTTARKAKKAQAARTTSIKILITFDCLNK